MATHSPSYRETVKNIDQKGRVHYHVFRVICFSSQDVILGFTMNVRDLMCLCQLADAVLFLRDPSRIPPTKARSLILPFFAPSKLPSRESRRPPLLTTLLFSLSILRRGGLEELETPLTGIHPNLDMGTTKPRSNLRLEPRFMWWSPVYGKEGKRGSLKDERARECHCTWNVLWSFGRPVR